MKDALSSRPRGGDELRFVENDSEPTRFEDTAMGDATSVEMRKGELDSRPGPMDGGELKCDGGGDGAIVLAVKAAKGLDAAAGGDDPLRLLDPNSSRHVVVFCDESALLMAGGQGSFW